MLLYVSATDVIAASSALNGETGSPPTAPPPRVRARAHRISIYDNHRQPSFEEENDSGRSSGSREGTPDTTRTAIYVPVPPPIGTRIMSIDSHEPQAAATSDSFWEISNYKRTVRRIEDGLKQCHALMQLVKERGEMEAHYAQSLLKWQRKWIDQIEKGPEYGTTAQAWKGVLSESEQLAREHYRMRDRLTDEVYKTTKIWSKEHFPKNALGQLKGVKEMEEEFKKAQKLWAKLHDKCDKAKRDYHTACRVERTAMNQERNATSDSGVSPDQLKKYTEKVEKATAEKGHCLEIYRKALDEVTRANPKYMEEMTVVFEKCQDAEQQRLKFFKEMFANTHRILDVSNDKPIHKIYEDLSRTIDRVSPEEDLRWWQKERGTGMPMNWPQFENGVRARHSIVRSEVASISRSRSKDLHLLSASNRLSTTSSNTTMNRLSSVNEQPAVFSEQRFTHKVEYSPDLRPISTKKEPSDIGPVLTSVRPTPPPEDRSSYNNHTNGGGDYHHDNHDPSPSNGYGLSVEQPATVSASAMQRSESTAPPPTENSASGVSHGSIAAPPQGDENEFAEFTPPPPTSKPSPAGNGDAHVTTPGAENPYTDDWRQTMMDDGSAGRPVRALFDYEAAEGDELSFRKGDCFEKLEDEDELGWCKGRKDGRVGLYPANYVEENS